MVEVWSRGPSGETYRVIFEKTGHDTCRLEVATWAAGLDPRSFPPTSVQVHDFYDVRVSGRSRIVCKANRWGPDPSIVCELQDGQPPQIRVTANLIPWDIYPLSPADLEKLRKFLDQARFP